MGSNSSPVVNERKFQYHSELVDILGAHLPNARLFPDAKHGVLSYSKRDILSRFASSFMKMNSPREAFFLTMPACRAAVSERPTYVRTERADGSPEACFVRSFCFCCCQSFFWKLFCPIGQPPSIFPLLIASLRRTCTCINRLAFACCFFADSRCRRD